MMIETETHFSFLGCILCGGLYTWCISESCILWKLREDVAPRHHQEGGGEGEREREVVVMMMMIMMMFMYVIMVIHVGGIELSDGWSVDETLEVRKLNASAGRFLKLELDIGDFEGGKNVKGITPIGFTVPDGSFHSKVRAASNNDMILSKNTKGEVYVRGNLTFEDHCHANQKFRKNICTTTHLDTAKAMSTYHVESTYYIPYEIIFRVDKSTTHLLADISFGLFSNVTRSNVKSFAAIRLELESHENERLLGFGNQPSYTNLKGTTFSINAQENGLGRGDEPITSALRVGEAVLDLLYHRKSTKTAGDSHTTYSAVCISLSLSIYLSLSLPICLFLCTFTYTYTHTHTHTGTDLSEFRLSNRDCRFHKLRGVRSKL